MQEQLPKSVPLWTKNFIGITLLNFLIFFSFQMLQPTLPIYVKQLGGGDAIIGLVTGLFTVTALVARPFSGMALDRIGRKQVFLVGLAIFILSVLAYSWFPIISLILVFRLIHGFGWGISNTAVNTIASDNIPKARFGEGMGYFSLASSLAMAIAPAVGLAFITKYTFHSLFLIAAGIIILVFLLVFTLKVRPIKKTSASVAASAAEDNIEVTTKNTEATNERTKLKAGLYEKSSIRPSVVIFFVCATYGAVVSFLSIYAAERGISNIGWFFTVYALSLLISRPFFGRINDRLGADFAIIPGLICMFIAMLLLAWAATMPAFLLVGFIYGIGFGAVQSTMQTMAVANVPQERRGAANATFFTGFDSGIGFGAIILGAVASATGYSQMYLWGALAIVIAFVLYFVLARRHQAA